MSENVQITPGIGQTIGADQVVDTDLGTASVQYVKVMDGAIGGVNKLSITVAGAVKTDGSGATQPISGTVTANAGTGTFSVDGSGHTQPISASALPLPTGAATETTLSALNGKVTAVNTGAVTISTALPAGTNVIGHVITDTGSTVAISNFPSTQPISGSVTVTQGTAANLNATITGTVTATQSGTWNVTNISGTVSLPTGASTSALQTTGNSSLSSVDGKTPALGQALAAASSPVVLTAAQIITLTPLSSVSVSNFPATQPVSGTVAVSSIASALPAGTNAIGHVIADTGSTTAVTGNVTAVQATGTNLHVVVDSAPTTAVTGTFFQATQPVSGPLTDTQLRASPVPVSGTFFQATQPISGTITANAGTGTFTVGQATGSNLHTVVDSGTITAVTAITNALPAGTNVIGHVIADTGSTTTVTGNVNAVQSGTWNVNDVPPTLTKGTQGATGFSTQDLKDAGRQYLAFTAVGIAGVVAEALVSFTQNKQGTTTAGVTSYTITSGKTLRIQSVTLYIRSGAAAVANTTINLRHNTAGATIATSALVWTGNTATSAAVSGTPGLPLQSPFPDGIEFFGNGTQSIGLSHLSSATTNVESISIVAYEY